MKFYTGIGSRETPELILKLFEKIAFVLAKNGYILRSGAAPGADCAFEIGCDKLPGKKEIYLPWPNFQESESTLIVSNKEAFEIAKKFHPYWENLKSGAKKLQARNSHQVLGQDLNTPSKFIICWTKDAKGKGGTGQAIRIANHYKIPIFDLGKYKTIYEAIENSKIFLKNIKHGNILNFPEKPSSRNIIEGKMPPKPKSMK